MATLIIGTTNIIISIGTAIWIFKDVQESHKSKGEAILWTIGTLLLWLIVLPAWLLTKPYSPGLTTENAKFKSKYAGFFFVGVFVSVVFHTGFIYLSPKFSIARIEKRQESFEVVDVPPEIVVPPPPQRVTKPAVPVEAAEEPEEEVTIADTTPEANVSIVTSSIDEERPSFTPYDKAPEEIPGTIRVEYPDILRKAEIQGVTILWLLVSKNGTVKKIQIAKSSGNSLMDQAAVKALQVARFKPALQRDVAVDVWVSWPVKFSLKN